MNVSLNFVLIPIIGAMGAAVASVATQIFVNVLIDFIIPPMRKNSSILFKGLNPKYVKNLFSSFKKKSGDN